VHVRKIIIFFLFSQTISDRENVARNYDLALIASGRDTANGDTPERNVQMVSPGLKNYGIILGREGPVCPVLIPLARRRFISSMIGCNVGGIAVSSVSTVLPW
jgi:hypothetical protein